MTETLNEYGTGDVKSEALEMSEKAKTLKVLNGDDYIAAGNMLRNIKVMRGKVTRFFEDMKGKSYAAWKAVCANENQYLLPLDASDKFLRSEVDRYLNEQEELRQEFQRKAEEVAMLAAEKEKEKLLKQAVKAEEKGNIEKAEALLGKAEEVYQAPVIVPSAVEKTTRLENGKLTRKADIQITITDALLFVKSVSEKRVPADCVEFKLNAIKLWAKKNNIKGAEIPGLLVKEIQVVTL